MSYTREGKDESEREKKGDDAKNVVSTNIVARKAVSSSLTFASSSPHRDVAFRIVFTKDETFQRIATIQGLEKESHFG